VISVLDHKGQRCAGGDTCHHPSQDADLIILDLHPRSGPETPLAAG
jgi:hypothetical protein